MSGKTLGHAACLAIVSLGLVGAAPSKSKPAATTLDRSILHVQVILDHLGFSPGVLDGRQGKSLVAALKGFQEQQGLPITGEADRKTLQALYPHRAWRPTQTIALTEEMLAGPYFNPLPKDPQEQGEAAIARLSLGDGETGGDVPHHARRIAGTQQSDDAPHAGQQNRDPQRRRDRAIL